MAVWEYKTIVRAAAEPLTDDQLNQMGTHGFELITVSVATAQVTVVGRHEQRTMIHYFFKRPKAPAQAAPPPAAAATTPRQA